MDTGGTWTLADVRASIVHRRRGMTARAATVKLYVSLVAVITAVLSLLGAVVRLGVALVALLAAAIETRTSARPRRDASATRDMASRPVPALRLFTAPPSTSPTPPAGPMPPTAAERLMSALVGLGFSSKDVAPVVASLGPSVEREALQTLIPVALRILAPAALAG